MQCSLTSNDDLVTVKLEQRLIYSDTSAFSKILEQVKNLALPSCIADLAALEHVDSSGLRMLLLLYDVCSNIGAKMTIRAAQGQVKEMLLHSRFDTIISLEG